MNTYKPIITMTLFRRPDYTEQVLQALSKCIGIEKYHMIISVDGDNKKVLQLANDYNSCSTKVIQQTTRLKCGPNTKFVLTEGFKETDYVIHIEDDTVPSSDMLRYMEWARQFESEDKCFSVTAYNHTVQPDNLSDVFRVRWFTPWIWATWKSRWSEMSSRWKHNWDSHLNKGVRGDRHTIKPQVSRAQNIGAIGGVCVPSAEFHRANHHTPIVSGPYYGDYVMLNGIREYEGP